MSVDYAKQIDDAVTKVSVAKGINRGQIAQDLGYTPTYISSAIKRGGNKKLLDKIKEKYSDVFATKSEPVSISKPDHYDQAVLKALIQDYLKLKAQVTKKSIDELADELDQNTRLILRDLKG